MRTRQKTPNEIIAQNHDVQKNHPGVAIPQDFGSIAGEGMGAYVTALRKERRRREGYFNGPIDGFVGAIRMRPEVEEKLVEQLRARVIDTTRPERSSLDAAFPSGTFLFHGAKTSSLVDILRSGYLMNARALGEKKERVDNGGEEGVSWSICDIEAIPSSRFHMAGFMASPEKILGERYQLAVPDNPAPYEIVQLSNDIDAREFYDKYTQARLCELVYDGLSRLLEGSTHDELNVAHGHADLREYYHKNSDGDVVLHRELSSRVDGDGEVFAAEVWMDAITTVGEAHKRDALYLAECLNKVELHILQLAKELNADVMPQNDVRIPVEKMYFVAPSNDIEKWLRVFVRCPVKPMGIIAYDNAGVRLEDFVNEHRGDGGELAKQLRDTIGSSPDMIDYSKALGAKFDDSMRDTKKPHVISPAHLDRTRTIVLQDGKLIVRD